MEAQWHRFKHYEHGWSGFDMVEKCKKPAFCVGCTYGHPFCNSTGKVLSEDEWKAGFKQSQPKLVRR
jgi:hypothetical protein